MVSSVKLFVHLILVKLIFTNCGTQTFKDTSILWIVTILVISKSLYLHVQDPTISQGAHNSTKKLTEEKKFPTLFFYPSLVTWSSMSEIKGEMTIVVPPVYKDGYW